MKGFLFTVGLVSMAAVILGLAFSVMQSSYVEQEDNIFLLMFDRLRDDAVWMENGFRDIVDAAGINITIENKTIMVAEPMPNKKAQNLSANIDNWKNFSSANTGFQAVFDVQDIKDYLPLHFSPSLVNYIHPNGPGGDMIRVEGSGQVSNYSIDIDIDIPEPITLTWTSIDNTPPSMGFRIKVHNTSDTIEEMQSLDMDDSSTLSISMASGTVTIDIGDATDRGLLEISNPNALNMTVATNITLSFINEPEIIFPGNVISLHSPAINATVAGPVKII